MCILRLQHFLWLYTSYTVWGIGTYTSPTRYVATCRERKQVIESKMDDKKKKETKERKKEWEIWWEEEERVIVRKKTEQKNGSASVTHTSLHPWLLISGLAPSWVANICYFEFSSYTTQWRNNLCLCSPSALCCNLCSKLLIKYLQSHDTLKKE